MFIKKHPWLLFSVLSANLFVLVPAILIPGHTPAATLQADEPNLRPSDPVEVHSICSSALWRNHYSLR